MPRIKPYQGTSHARLSQLIRDAQQPPLPASVTFTFDVPTPGTLPEPGATQVDATAKSGFRRDEPVTTNYRRLSGEVLKQLPAGELVPFDPITFPTNMHEILPQINEALGLNLIAEEVQNVALPSIPINGITITIKNTSLAWLAGDYFFQYAPHSIERAGRGVNDAIPTDELQRIRVLEAPIG